MAIISCEKETTYSYSHENGERKENSKQHLSNGLILSKISRQEVKHAKVLESIDKIAAIKNNAIANRTITNDSLQISIQDNFIGYLESEDGTYHSYTFKAIDHLHANGLKNLMLSLQPDGSYKERLVWYDITEEEKDMLQNNYELDLTNRVYYHELENGTFANDIAARTYYNSNCEITTEWVASTTPCTGPPGSHSPDPNNALTCSFPYPYGAQTSYSLITSMDCTFSSGGGSQTTGTTGNPNTNNHSNGNSNNNDYTTPVDCKPNNPDCIEDDVDLQNDNEPCDKLKEYEEDSYIKQQLSALVPIAENDNVDVEIAILLKKNDDNTWGGTTRLGTPENPYVSFTMEAGVTIDIFTHTHFNGNLSIFSPPDLQAYHQILDNNFSANGTDLVFVLITNSGTKYAFKITDLTKFNAIAQEHFQNTEDLNKFSEDEFEGIKAENNNDINELAFLKMMKKVDLGISLFKANNDFSEWKELSLNNTEDDVIESGCN